MLVLFDYLKTRKVASYIAKGVKEKNQNKIVVNILPKNKKEDIKKLDKEMKE